MENRTTKITATLRGIRPILFDRYPGDNQTVSKTRDKLYVNARMQCCIPTLNLYSLLSASNTPSVPKRFYGKLAANTALGVLAFASIESDDPDDPNNCPIMDESGTIYTIDDPRILEVAHVARLAKGIPNPKLRPMIPTGWSIRLVIELIENKFVSLATFKQMVEQGGILGLGTFRPIFGRYTVVWS